MADAKKLMSRKDRKEFQWTLEEYEQHAKADLLSGITSANVMNASANWHLTYLDGMKLQLEHHVDKLYKNIDSKTRNHFKESLNENYLNTAFELQKGIGIGEKMEVPYDERKLENILRTPWASDGKNFSNRIWRDRTQLVNNLQKNLSESVIRGDSDTDMIQALSKDEKRAEFNTRRLVETESAYFDSLSEQECCEDFGVEKYRFLAVLDMKTSDICQELDNKVFLEKDRQVGVNAPPMHPFCRSTTAPVIDEEFLTSRRAKNPKTGEYDEIPPEMNYKQWKEKYVEGKDNAEEVKQEASKGTGANETSNDSSLRGAEMKVFPKEVNAPEGEIVYTNTDLQSFREKYDKEVQEKVEKRVAEEREKLEAEFAKKQEELTKVKEVDLDLLPVNLDFIDKQEALEEYFGMLNPSDDLKDIIIAGKLSKANGVIITPQQAGKMRIAIEKYTKDGIDNFYGEIRRAQKAQQENITNKESLELIGKYEDFIKNIENFIRISPKYKGRIYRGIALETLYSNSYLTKGKKTPYTMRGMSSWSTSLEQAKEYAKKNQSEEKPNCLVFIMENCKTGTSVRHLSKAPIDEKEILVSGHTYLISNNIEQKDGFYYIYVKEQ